MVRSVDIIKKTQSIKANQSLNINQSTAFYCPFQSRAGPSPFSRLLCFHGFIYRFHSFTVFTSYAISPQCPCTPRFPQEVRSPCSHGSPLAFLLFVPPLARKVPLKHCAELAFVVVSRSGTTRWRTRRKTFSTGCSSSSGSTPSTHVSESGYTHLQPRCVESPGRTTASLDVPVSDRHVGSGRSQGKHRKDTQSVNAINPTFSPHPNFPLFHLLQTWTWLPSRYLLWKKKPWSKKCRQESSAFTVPIKRIVGGSRCLCDKRERMWACACFIYFDGLRPVQVWRRNNRDLPGLRSVVKASLYHTLGDQVLKTPVVRYTVTPQKRRSNSHERNTTKKLA